MKLVASSYQAERRGHPQMEMLPTPLGLSWRRISGEAISIGEIGRWLSSLNLLGKLASQKILMMPSVPRLQNTESVQDEEHVST